MKRRMMIAKALSHQPNILFLDEPTAGVDVELRRGMWDLVRKLRDAGTTIILTTHYLEEAEEMADRVGVIRQGELILVEDKKKLMQKLGKKKLTLTLAAPLAALPASLQTYPLSLAEDGRELTYNLWRGWRRGACRGAVRRSARGRRRDQRSAHRAEFAGRHFRQPHRKDSMNFQAIRAIYIYEMSRTRRTLLQSILSPILSTALYFVVFGSAIGSRISHVGGVSYGAFIVPGLIMLNL